jgi:predicted MFS family arabinose efflux permease
MTPRAAWRSLSPNQRRSGLAGWLGWLFDGLDMHLYTLVATPFVAALLLLEPSDKAVGHHGAIIQAAFLVGWALGGAFFGVIGDRLGRSRTLVLTILTYSVFCGLSAIATEWWHLMIFRFLSALGIGGEWAVGAALLSETLPKSWRHWIAAVLQTAVNVGILLACLAGVLMKDFSPRYIFLVGVLPALITLWIRRAVPETEAWTSAVEQQEKPSIGALFRHGQASVTIRALVLCGLCLTAHWAFMFWQQSFIRQHPEVRVLSPGEQTGVASTALALIVCSSIAGNFLSAAMAGRIGYGRTILIFCLFYAGAMVSAFSTDWSYAATLRWYAVIGLAQGFFGLFTMCLPPLFPVLLRTTGAGFCYNAGRLAAAAGTVFFGLFNSVDRPGQALLYASFLFIPAAIVALFLPEPPQEA